MVSFQGSLGRNPSVMEATRGAWIERKAANPKMHLAVSGLCTEDYTRDLEAAGIPVYEETTHATRATAVLAGFARSFRERRPRPTVPAPAELPSGPGERNRRPRPRRRPRHPAPHPVTGLLPQSAAPLPPPPVMFRPRDR